MENKQALTLVSLEFLNLDEIEKYLSHNFSISINSKKSFSINKYDNMIYGSPLYKYIDLQNKTSLFIKDTITQTTELGSTNTL